VEAVEYADERGQIQSQPIRLVRFFIFTVLMLFLIFSDCLFFEKSTWHWPDIKELSLFLSDGL